MIIRFPSTVSVKGWTASSWIGVCHWKLTNRYIVLPIAQIKDALILLNLEHRSEAISIKTSFLQQKKYSVMTKSMEKNPKIVKLRFIAALNLALTFPDLRMRPSSRSIMYTSSPGVTPSDCCCSFIHLNVDRKIRSQDKRTYIWATKNS